MEVFRVATYTGSDKRIKYLFENGGGGSGGGIGVIDELWTNSNPVSVGQFTITVNDMSDYDFIGVVFEQNINDPGSETPLEIVQKSSGQKVIALNSSGSDGVISRALEILSATQIQFTNGFKPNIGYYSNLMIPLYVYGIKSGNTMHTYSTTEQVIGTWIDGKLVYERVIEFSNSLEVSYNSFTNTSIGSTNIENIISAIGIHADGTNYGTLIADPTRQSHTVIGLQTDRNGSVANIKKLIIQYTKTTD